MRKFALLITACLCLVHSAFASDFTSPLVRVNSGNSGNDSAPEYDLARMRQVNPDFVTYPDASGIIWLKHVSVSRSEHGGMQTTRLYVIRGRRGLESKWLNWNIQTPSKGSVTVLEAGIYDSASGAQIGSISPVEDSASGLTRVNFSGLPDNFILVLSWREVLPEQLAIEGICHSQEELRVWESVLEITSPQKLTYRTFPEREVPETEHDDNGNSYTWRKINIEPYIPSGELVRSQRAGVAFSTREGDSGLTGIIRSAENAGSIPEPQQTRKLNASGVIDWLSRQPEVILSEGSSRKIPASSSSGWTRREKILLAKSWLSSRKVNANIVWQLPFEPDEDTPLCPELFCEPVLEIHEGKKSSFHDMTDSRLLAGARIYGFDDNRITQRRVPALKSGENRLSAVMTLTLDSDGMLSGPVKVFLRGAWGPFLLGFNHNHKPSDGMARGALLSLFPGLTNYSDVKYSNSQGTPVISFILDRKPGISGSGVRWLARPPFFEPAAVRALGAKHPPLDVKFPFIVDQNITINYPKNAHEALVSGKTPKNPDKINYSDESRSKKHSFVTQARLEVNMQNVSEGSIALLQKTLNQWRSFGARNIPVR